MSEYDRLLEKTRSSGVWVAEVLCRKYLSEHSDDTRAWRLLFAILEHTKNYKEVVLLVNDILKNKFTDNSITTLCLQYLLYSGDYKSAQAIFTTLDSEKIPRDFKLHNDIYHLELLTAIENNSGNFNSKFNTLSPHASEFNRKSLRLNKSNAVEVVCYLKQEFHYVIQEKIADKLCDEGVNVFFSNCLWFIKAVRPRVLLLSEALYEKLPDVRDSLPNTLIVNTRHGLGDKNHAALGASQADRICVSSEKIGRVLIEQMSTPEQKIWVTGYPQMDPVFNSDKNKLIEESDLASKVVLFAPTFNPELSSAYMLKNNLVRKIRGDNESIKIVVKPHPHLLRDSPEMISSWLQESKLHSNVHIDVNPNSNIMNIFDGCDLMISDVSSAALAWFAVNKPLICLIDTEKAQVSKHFSVDGIEWQMHEASIVVNKPDKLSQVVSDLLLNPDIKLEERRRFSDYLFGDLRDGKSSHRVAINIMNHLSGRQ